MKSQNEYYYKLKLKEAIEGFIENEIGEDHDIGILPDELSANMAEAAWLILQQNKDLYDFLLKQDMVK